MLHLLLLWVIARRKTRIVASTGHFVLLWRLCELLKRRGDRSARETLSRILLYVATSVTQSLVLTVVDVFATCNLHLHFF